MQRRLIAVLSALVVLLSTGALLAWPNHKWGAGGELSASQAATLYVVKAGDTMTGTLNISDGTKQLNIGQSGFTTTASIALKKTAVAATAERLLIGQISDSTSTLELKNRSTTNAVFSPAIVGSASDAIPCLTVAGNGSAETATEGVRIQGGRNETTGFSTLDPVTFYNGATLIGRYTAAGNFGVGSAAPGYLVHGQ